METEVQIRPIQVGEERFSYFTRTSFFIPSPPRPTGTVSNTVSQPTVVRLKLEDTWTPMGLRIQLSEGDRIIHCD